MLLTIGWLHSPLGLVLTLIATALGWWGAVRVGKRRGHRTLGWVLGALFGWVGLVAMLCVPSTRAAKVARRAEQLAIEQAARASLHDRPAA